MSALLCPTGHLVTPRSLQRQAADLPDDLMVDLVRRRARGESYDRLAADLDVSAPALATRMQAWLEARGLPPFDPVREARVVRSMGAVRAVVLALLLGGSGAALLRAAHEPPAAIRATPVVTAAMLLRVGERCPDQTPAHDHPRKEWRL